MTSTERARRRLSRAERRRRLRQIAKVHAALNQPTTSVSSKGTTR